MAAESTPCWFDGASFGAVDEQTLRFHVVATTLKGAIKTWATLDAAAKWVRLLGIGAAQLQLAKWAPDQKALDYR